jgi:hypothetical protein
MGGLSEAKFEVVRTLVESAPDRVIGGLQKALSMAEGDSSLGNVRKLVETEVADRRLRNTVLAAVAPLCVGDGGREGLAFPPRVLSMLWKALKADAPADVARAARHLVDFSPDESSPAPFDQLVERLASGLRGAGAPYRAAVEALGEQRDLLLSCLDLSPIVRAATLRLPEWIAHTFEERAAARVAYADAVTISPDAGPRFFDMLSAQLAEPWRVLRIVAAVMDRPTEAYMAGSEFAVFAERLMETVDQNLRQIGQFDPAGGAKLGRQMGLVVELTTLQLSELEDSIELSPEGRWGGRIRKQRTALATTVERRLREIDKALGLAMPEHPVRVARAMKSLPRMTTDPDPAAAEGALCLLTFAEEIRTSANYGGFASARTRAVEKAGESLDHYVEEVLDMLKHHEIEDRDRARRYLEVAGRCAALVYEPRAQAIIARRAAAALGAPRPAAQAAEGEVRLV